MHESALPYVTGDAPGIGGELRAVADHFVVEEIPLYEPQGDGEHLYVRLTKVGLTTKEVQHRLERLFGLPRDSVGFAGLKDKQARTTQTFSLAVGRRSADFSDEAVARIEENLPVTVHWVRFHRNKLRRGHLLGNRFVITVSGLDLPAEEAWQRAQAIAVRLRRHGLPNYFGPQRFGVGGDNAQRGLEVLLGQRKVKDRWLRRFLVASYQSHLCNIYLARRMVMGAFDHLLPGDVAKKYATGGMFDVEDVAVEQVRYAAQEISFTAPIFGAKMWAAKDEAGRLEADVLAASTVTLDHLRAAGAEGTRRLGRLLVPDLELQPPADAHAGELTLSFSLPKGAFATTVLREIMKVDLAQAPEGDDDEQ